MDSKNFIKELKEHIPFTIFATLTAILITIIILYLFQGEISERIFESAHILHVVASAMVTAGIYHRYNPKIILSIIVGMLGAITIGSLSDIIFPWMGGMLFGLDMHFHLPLIEIPLIILAMSFVGSLIGIKTNITKSPHFIHVFLSVFASLFYLLAFSASFEPVYFIGAFAVVFVSVIIPCCISDLTFPFFFLKNKRKKS